MECIDALSMSFRATDFGALDRSMPSISCTFWPKSIDFGTNSIDFGTLLGGFVRCFEGFVV